MVKKKKKKQQQLQYNTGYFELNASWWCMTHGGVKIYPIVESSSEKTYKICVEYFEPNRARKVVSPKVYSGMEEVTAKMYDIYVYEFKKNAGQDIVKKSHKSFLKRI